MVSASIAVVARAHAPRDAGARHTWGHPPSLARGCRSRQGQVCVLRPWGSLPAGESTLGRWPVLPPPFSFRVCHPESGPPGARLAPWLSPVGPSASCAASLGQGSLLRVGVSPVATGVQAAGGGGCPGSERHGSLGGEGCRLPPGMCSVVSRGGEARHGGLACSTPRRPLSFLGCRGGGHGVSGSRRAAAWAAPPLPGGVRAGVREVRGLVFSGSEGDPVAVRACMLRTANACHTHPVRASGRSLRLTTALRSSPGACLSPVLG